MGGVWERQIRSIRRVLATVMTEQVPTNETLTTFLVMAEGIINNRPMTPTSSDPNDLEPLTPNHLLIHRPATMPKGMIERDMSSYRNHWRQVQHLANEFWKRWSREYLISLRQRTIWHGPQRNVAVGDLVLIVDKPLPRNEWSLGRIDEVRNGQDGLVRAARIKTKNGYTERPVTKLCILEEAGDRK